MMPAVPVSDSMPRLMRGPPWAATISSAAAIMRRSTSRVRSMAVPNGISTRIDTMSPSILGMNVNLRWPPAGSPQVAINIAMQIATVR